MIVAVSSMALLNEMDNKPSALISASNKKCASSNMTHVANDTSNDSYGSHNSEEHKHEHEHEHEHMVSTLSIVPLTAMVIIAMTEFTMTLTVTEIRILLYHRIKMKKSMMTIIQMIMKT